KEIAEKKNYDMKRASDDFYNGGFKIYSTIDPNLQNYVDKVFSNPSAYGINASSGSDIQASMTILDYKGHVVALSGGIGQKTENLGYNRALQAVRQPGSTMKPIAAYAPAIDKKLKIQGKIATYSTIVPDFNKTYNLGGKTWKPNNWYGGHWDSKTIQFAVMRSMNTVPVEIVDLLTPDFCYDFLTKKLGITTLNEEDKNLSPLGMGGTNGGLTTFESAAAYAVFGNDGRYYAPCLYYKVCDQYDNVVLENKEKSTYAIASDTATVMNKILQTVVDNSQGTGAGIRSIISKDMKIYAKTGTSNNANDLWFVGGTPYYVASCWCGYDTPRDVKPENIAWKLWGNVMKEVHKDLPAKDFEISPDVRCYKYCTHTGDLATDKCPSTAIGWYKKNGLPSVCKSHPGTALGMISSNNEEKKAS
ncbi:MAG TPA: hypothetical protein DEW35_00350, partial [Ruminococcaceae bacterium]|nr:hypothetical protein [Oscillospiraceae bacterium]